MIVYFLIDTSGSMEGAKIGALNDAITNILTELRDVGDEQLSVAVLQFSKTVRWMTEKPRPVSSFEWVPLEANGMTAMGQACIELAKCFVDDPVSNKDTIVVLISYSYHTDDFDEGIDTLMSTLSFQSCKRYAVAVEGADISALTRFTGDASSVYSVSNLNDLTSILSDMMPVAVNDTNRVTDDVADKDEDDDEWA